MAKAIDMPVSSKIINEIWLPNSIIMAIIAPIPAPIPLAMIMARPRLAVNLMVIWALRLPINIPPAIYTRDPINGIFNKNTNGMGIMVAKIAVILPATNQCRSALR